MSIQSGESIEEIKRINKEIGVNKAIEEKKENYWLDCLENPSDEDIRLAKEFYKYWQMHGLLPHDVSVQELKRCYVRANAHFIVGDDKDGNFIYELLDINSKI